MADDSYQAEVRHLDVDSGLAALGDEASLEHAGMIAAPADIMRPVLECLFVDVPGRNLPPRRGDDRQVLTGWLDWQRATVRAKCQGLDESAGRRSLIPTSPELTVAGIVVHLTDVERNWIAGSFCSDVPVARGTAWGSSTCPLVQILDDYDAQCAKSRLIVSRHVLDELQTHTPDGLQPVSLRWILGHLIEETARHLGHLDLLREMLDGQRGY